MATRHYWINKISKSLEMKSIREIFKNNPTLLDEPEVAQLIKYCEQLQDEIVEFNLFVISTHKKRLLNEQSFFMSSRNGLRHKQHILVAVV